MSTKKLKDATKQLSNTTKTKNALEATKKEGTKLKVSSRGQNKRHDEDEDKSKKQSVRSRLTNSTSTRNVSKPALSKKVANTAKPSSSRAVTPPSSRVTKTQFFPSKKMYSNALKNDSSRIENEVLSSSTVKKISKHVADDTSSDTSTMSERPRTATLRKGSIVNKNIVGPEAPKTKESSNLEAQFEYEDDFDSYESDFDEYKSSNSSTNLSGTTSSSESELTEHNTSQRRVSSAGTDDERKLDSGNYELPENRHRQILDNIKESIERENSALAPDHNRNNLGSLSDEGFEDGKSLQFINFLGAQKKYQHRKSVELRRKRGEEILSMIRLDQYSFTLLDLAPVPYDTFIKNFGKSNSVQVSIQTGEDDIDEETQTEKITHNNKWTQCPTIFSKLEENEFFWGVYKCNYLGVGGDSIESTKKNIIYNENNLRKFLLNAGNLILSLQAEANMQVTVETNKSNIPFSKGCVQYNTQNVKILKGRPIIDVCFYLNNSNRILSVHNTTEESNYEESVICLWNISNTEIPEMILFAYGAISCCTFSFECPNLIFGGLTSGVVVVWDINESSISHKNVSNNFESDFIVRSPTYSTEINMSHFSKIISVQSIKNTEELNLFSFHNATEVCSLDEDGDLIIWSVILRNKFETTRTENQGLAHWGSVILTVNSKISLKKLYPEIHDFNCTDLTFSQFNSSSLYISTNYGIIIHCLINGGKPIVKKFLPNAQSRANCLEMCPFSSEYFLAGFDNGDINFYFRTIKKPLKVLSNKDSLEGKTKVEKIQWSHNRPLIFYVKDITNTIHIWNLKISDMFPICSIPFKNKVTCMKLSNSFVNNDSISEQPYMIIAGEGMIYVHLLGEGYDQQSTEDFEKDKNNFLNYINRYI